MDSEQPLTSPRTADNPIDRAFAAFHIPNYPWLFANVMSSSGARWLEVLAQGWLILELADSPFWVGASAGIRGITGIFLPFQPEQHWAGLIGVYSIGKISFYTVFTPNP